MSDYVPVFVLRQEDEECPRGSKFYRCQDNLFSGCCSVDPCDRADCPDQSNKTEGDDVKNDEDDQDEEANSTTSLTEMTTTTITVPVIASSSLPESVMISSSIISEVMATPADLSISSDIIQATPVASPTASVDPTVTGTAVPSETVESGGGGGLSTSAIGGIAGGAVAFAFVIGGIVYLIVRRNNINLGRIFRLRDNDDDSGYDLQPYTLPNTNPAERRDVFDNPFGPRYEEPQSRFTRACAYTTGAMRNHSVDHQTHVDNMTPTLHEMPGAPYRAVTPHERVSEASSKPSNPFSDDHRNVSRDDHSQADWSRAYTTTPEVYGPPKTARVLDFREAGLPRFIDISSSNRISQRTYIPYRPNAQFPPSAVQGPSQVQASNKSQAAPPNSQGVAAHGLRGDLNATAEDRDRNKYVNSWSRWEPDTTH